MKTVYAGTNLVPLYVIKGKAGIAISLQSRAISNTKTTYASKFLFKLTPSVFIKSAIFTLKPISPL